MYLGAPQIVLNIVLIVLTSWIIHNARRSLPPGLIFYHIIVNTYDIQSFVEIDFSHETGPLGTGLCTTYQNKR